MSMTLAQYKDRIRAAIGRGTDKDSELPYWIYWATIRIAEKHTFREMIKTYEGTLVEDTTRINVPEAWKDIYWCAIATESGGVYTEDSRLTPYGIKRFDKEVIFVETFDSAKPKQYAWVGNVIKLPAPSNAEYAIRFRVGLWPSLVTSDAAKLEYKNRDRVILAFALAEAFQSLGMKSDAAYWNIIAEKRLIETTTGDRLHGDMKESLGGRQESPEVSSNYHAMPFIRRNP